MPIFELEAGGKRYEVEAPDERAAINALGLTSNSAATGIHPRNLSPDNPFADLVRANSPTSTLPPGFSHDGAEPSKSPSQPAWHLTGPEPEPQTNTIDDVVRSGASGLVRGGAGIAGFAGDMDQAARQGAMWVLEKLGLPREALAAMENAPSVLPTSRSLIGRVEKLTGPLHQPQTTAGEYARTIGEFAPAAIAGPGRALAKTAMAVLPGAASETAGRLAQGTGPTAEGAARVAGALAGGLPAARLAAPRAAARAAPSTEELRTAAQSAYARAEQAGLTVAPQSFHNMAVGTAIAAKRAGIDKSLHPEAMAALNRMITAAKSGQPLSLQELDTLRQVVKDAAASPKASERRIAQILVGRLDDYMETLTTKDVLAGDAKTAVNAVREARGLWSRMRKGEVIDDLIDRARNATGANYTQAGMETALRQQFRLLANNKALMRTFTKEEQGAIRRVVRGGPIENVLRLAGKFAIRGPLSGGVSLGVAGFIDPVSAGVIAGTGELARRGAAALTARNANRVGEAVRGGIDPQSTLPAMRARTLLALEPASTSWRLDTQKRPNYREMFAPAGGF
jgi:hypothetical protein